MYQARHSLILATLMAAFTLTAAHAAEPGLHPERLRVEALVNPLGIDAQPPALSWIVAADGNLLAEYDLPACPVFDGMSATIGKLLVPMVNGQVQCMTIE